MKITEKNYIQQLQLHNEEALIYVIDMYGGLLKAVIRKHLFYHATETGRMHERCAAFHLGTRSIL